MENAFVVAEQHIHRMVCSSQRDNRMTSIVHNLTFNVREILCMSQWTRTMNSLDQQQMRTAHNGKCMYENERKKKSMHKGQRIRILFNCSRIRGRAEQVQTYRGKNASVSSKRQRQQQEKRKKTNYQVHWYCRRVQLRADPASAKYERSKFGLWDTNRQQISSGNSFVILQMVYRHIRESKLLRPFGTIISTKWTLIWFLPKCVGTVLTAHAKRKSNHT